MGVFYSNPDPEVQDRHEKLDSLDLVETRYFRKMEIIQASQCQEKHSSPDLRIDLRLNVTLHAPASPLARCPESVSSMGNISTDRTADQVALAAENPSPRRRESMGESDLNKLWRSSCVVRHVGAPHRCFELFHRVASRWCLTFLCRWKLPQGSLVPW